MVSEFEFIHNIKSKFALRHVGDDCAVLPKDGITDSLLTADLLIEDVDFRLEWAIPELLGHKALAVSLSDIAAMGGTPKWAMLSLGIPEKLWKSSFLDQFYEGWFNLARECSVELVGGDISRSPDKVVIDSIVAGECPKEKAILRSTARVGDSIYVSGTLGGSAGGLKLLESGMRSPGGSEIEQDLLFKQLRPNPQYKLAKILQRMERVTAMIDVSDGFSSDLSHICKQSGVGATIHAERLPIDPKLTARFPREECLSLALDGGEDFQLLLTAGPANDRALESLGLTRVGEITSNTDLVELVLHQGSTVLESRGHRHF